MCCAVGFKPTVTYLLVVIENGAGGGGWAIEEYMIRSNRKGKMDIYLPYLHVFCSNNYSNNDNKELDASSLLNILQSYSPIFTMPLQAGWCLLSLFYK